MTPESLAELDAEAFRMEPGRWFNIYLDVTSALRGAWADLAAEREACAKLAETTKTDPGYLGGYLMHDIQSLVAVRIATAIRARVGLNEQT